MRECDGEFCTDFEHQPGCNLFEGVGVPLPVIVAYTGRDAEPERLTALEAAHRLAEWYEGGRDLQAEFLRDMLAGCSFSVGEGGPRFLSLDHARYEANHWPAGA